MKNHTLEVQTEASHKWSRTTQAVLLLLGVFWAGTSGAQNYKVLHDFGTNTMGFHPQAALVAGPDGFLYGTAMEGGGYNRGQVFKVRTDGTAYESVKDFSGADGAWPIAGLVLDGPWLYGVTQGGGSNELGTVFKVQTNGAAFTILRKFEFADGAFPETRLLLVENTLYGVTSGGGPENQGVVFSMNTDGGNFTVLKTFTMELGAYPHGALVHSGNTLYGTTSGGGIHGGGILFAIATDGSGFSVLKNFAEADGSGPYGELVLAGDVIWGCTVWGGDNSNGTIFRINTDGSGFAVLHHFSAIQGAYPYAGLLPVGATLYGVTTEGGNAGNGSLFKIEPDGSAFEILKDFGGWAEDGGFPVGGLVETGTHLYGTTAEGGAFNYGTVFRIQTNGGDFVRILDLAGGDGIRPLDLTLAGDTFYGVTEGGGRAGNGTLFRMERDGSGYAIIKDFTNALEGVAPNCLPLVANEIVYGSARYGGVAWNGTLFKLNTNGSGFTVLKDFTNTLEGCNPSGELVLMNDVLFGTTSGGGISNGGTLFRMRTDGTDYLVLRHFNDVEGCTPSAGLISDGLQLYGTTLWGGSNGSGMVFRVDPTGTDFAVLPTAEDGTTPESLMWHEGTLFGFAAGGGNGYGTFFRMDVDGGAMVTSHPFDWTTACAPAGKPWLIGDTLFGIASSGGKAGNGAVFQINASGSNFCVLNSFKGAEGCNPFCLSAGFVISETTLFGTTTYGGHSDGGVLYRLALEPQIAALPPSRTVEVGASTAWFIPITGSPPFGYNWFLNGTNLSEQLTTNALQLTVAQQEQAGDYTLVVTNAFGSCTSAPVSVGVIPVVPRRPAAGLALHGEPGLTLHVEYADNLSAPVNWQSLELIPMTSASQLCFDGAAPLPPARFYRAWQNDLNSTPPVLDPPFMVTVIPLTGSVGQVIQLEGINAIGPTDAWFNLATLTLTNSSQLYFDLTAIGQPARLYRVTMDP
jgi:uncharacterized repeat protein (TIGR03803 family)